MTIKKITVEQLECNRCNYKWFPRITRDGKTVIPKTCPNPKCKSPYWNKVRVFGVTMREGKEHERKTKIITDKRFSHQK